MPCSVLLRAMRNPNREARLRRFFMLMSRVRATREPKHMSQDVFDSAASARDAFIRAFFATLFPAPPSVYVRDLVIPGQLIGCPEVPDLIKPPSWRISCPVRSRVLDFINTTNVCGWRWGLVVDPAMQKEVAARDGE